MACSISAEALLSAADFVAVEKVIGERRFYLTTTGFYCQPLTSSQFYKFHPEPFYDVGKARTYDADYYRAQLIFRGFSSRGQDFEDLKRRLKSADKNGEGKLDDAVEQGLRKMSRILEKRKEDWEKKERKQTGKEIPDTQKRPVGEKILRKSVMAKAIKVDPELIPEREERSTPDWARGMLPEQEIRTPEQEQRIIPDQENDAGPEERSPEQEERRTSKKRKRQHGEFDGGLEGLEGEIAEQLYEVWVSQESFIEDLQPSDHNQDEVERMRERRITPVSSPAVERSFLDISPLQSPRESLTTISNDYPMPLISSPSSRKTSSQTPSIRYHQRHAASQSSEGGSPQSNHLDEEVPEIDGDLETSPRIFKPLVKMGDRDSSEDLYGVSEAGDSNPIADLNEISRMSEIIHEESVPDRELEDQSSLRSERLGMDRHGLTRLQRLSSQRGELVSPASEGRSQARIFGGEEYFLESEDVQLTVDGEDDGMNENEDEDDNDDEMTRRLSWSVIKTRDLIAEGRRALAANYGEHHNENDMIDGDGLPPPRKTAAQSRSY